MARTKLFTKETIELCRANVLAISSILTSSIELWSLETGVKITDVLDASLEPDERFFSHEYISENPKEYLRLMTLYEVYSNSRRICQMVERNEEREAIAAAKRPRSDGSFDEQCKKFADDEFARQPFHEELEELSEDE